MGVEIPFRVMESLVLGSRLLNENLAYLWMFAMMVGQIEVARLHVWVSNGYYLGPNTYLRISSLLRVAPCPTELSGAHVDSCCFFVQAPGAWINPYRIHPPRVFVA